MLAAMTLVSLLCPPLTEQDGYVVAADEQTFMVLNRLCSANRFWFQSVHLATGTLLPVKVQHTLLTELELEMSW